MSYIDTSRAFPYRWYVRLILARQRRRYGRTLEPARLWGRTPRAFVAMALMYRALDRKRSPIEPSLRSLVQVRVAQINACAFCTDFNAAAGRQRGLSDEVFRALARFEESSLFTARQKAAIAWAEAMTDSARRTDGALFERLRQYFDDDAIVDLTALVAYQNMSAKFNAALGVPSGGLCPRLNGQRNSSSRPTAPAQ